jgi:RHS repeat-associated protein
MTTSKQYDYFHPVRYCAALRDCALLATERWEGRCGEQRLSHGVNQITSRGVPGYVDVMGDALATNSVTVHPVKYAKQHGRGIQSLRHRPPVAIRCARLSHGVNGAAAYRKNEFFRDQLSVANTANPVWQSVTNASPGQTTVTGHLYLAKNPETNMYDADGNLLSDGRWSYAWDGENRLIGMTSLSSAPSGSQLQLAFAYDYQGRRIQKTVSTNNGSAYVGEYTNNYAYDGWNLIATLNSSLAILNSYLWGSDLSGSIQGAGGVGGLLAENIAGNGVQYVAYDGNGNVSALVNAANGATVANYEYGPFGEVIRATGPMAKLNPFRFSTKYEDDETDLLYYGYRYYNASTGRWLSRDPIDQVDLSLIASLQGASGNVNSPLGPMIGLFPERFPDGANLYGFVGNNSVSKEDPFGLLTAGDFAKLFTMALLGLPPQYKGCLGQCYTTYNGCFNCCGFVSVEGGMLISGAYAACNVAAISSPIIGFPACKIGLIGALKKLNQMDASCKSACVLKGCCYGDPSKFTITIP